MYRWSPALRASSDPRRCLGGGRPGSPGPRLAIRRDRRPAAAAQFGLRPPELPARRSRDATRRADVRSQPGRWGVAGGGCARRHRLHVSHGQVSGDDGEFGASRAFMGYLPRPQRTRRRDGRHLYVALRSSSADRAPACCAPIRGTKAACRAREARSPARVAAFRPPPEPARSPRPRHRRDERPDRETPSDANPAFPSRTARPNRRRESRCSRHVQTASWPWPMVLASRHRRCAGGRSLNRSRRFVVPRRDDRLATGVVGADVRLRR